MKTILCIALLCLSLFTHATGVETLKGEWEQFNTGLEKKYTYFRLNSDLTGVFASVRGKGKLHIDKFNSSQVKINDGIFEINFDESSEYKAKLLLSSYGKASEHESDLATGMLYMFVKEKKDWRLFNTIFVRLTRIDGKSFINRIDSLYEKLRDNSITEN